MHTLLSGKMTIYKDNEFYVNSDKEKGIYIYTWNKDIVDDSFIQISSDKGTKYKKYVHRSEIGEIYEFNK